ncbi:hypothetical protein Glove_642g16 [Diversispora epigaea]|uniref:F-box domain-containing protein n=1 Tax=Diversispora epigaea TaxID=1348612 RepID=A0A397G5N5_9GLOM|nr:hypothetical protein Glove_642g16 [Diversispora epigaea]
MLINKLPIEILIDIFELIFWSTSFQDISKLKLICKEWKSLIEKIIDVKLKHLVKTRNVKIDLYETSENRNLRKPDHTYIGLLDENNISSEYIFYLFQNTPKWVVKSHSKATLCLTRESPSKDSDCIELYQDLMALMDNNWLNKDQTNILRDKYSKYLGFQVPPSREDSDFDKYLVKNNNHNGTFKMPKERYIRDNFVEIRYPDITFSWMDVYNKVQMNKEQKILIAAENQETEDSDFHRYYLYVKIGKKLLMM